MGSTTSSNTLDLLKLLLLYALFINYIQIIIQLKIINLVITVIDLHTQELSNRMKIL